MATSFSERVAYGFLYNKFAEGKTPVKWIVEMDERGRDDPVLQCKQVNFVDTNTLGEEEFLFAPYSVFSVLEVRVPASPAAAPSPASTPASGGSGGAEPRATARKSLTCAEEWAAEEVEEEFATSPPNWKYACSRETPQAGPSHTS